MTKLTLHEKLSDIQANLSAPKGQYNSFGKYKYRSCEDILTAVKPLNEKHGLVLTMHDEAIAVGDRFFIRSTGKLSDGKEEISVNALAELCREKKGMDVSQITGSTSSYARKYMLNGLYAIDDSKDADTMDNTAQPKQTTKPTPVKQGTVAKKKTEQEYIEEYADKFIYFEEKINGAETLEALHAAYIELQQVIFPKIHESHVIKQFFTEMANIKDKKKVDFLQKETA
ncbi:Essential recombination function protein [uncultured Caudovirales phage]|uniref:Essential recombination function protein n=1 Tax=uncultured Caudovirales phage TaxID=2100421 RepID=A0A6J5S499_9CAUD|nr:Essential recombination function protein [uncultured Caudovirales phage]